MSIKHRAAKGGLWVFIDQIGVQLISFILNIILARILEPKDFGTIALFTVIITICSVLVNGGLSSSIIRSKEIDNRDLSTVFWFNLGSSIILYIIIYLIAPYFANFYNLEILIPIIRVYGLIILIDCFVHVQSVLLDKKMDFKTGFKIRIPSYLIGGISGVVLAKCGYGVWSLVYSALIQNSLFTIQHWIYSDWKPSFIFDRKKFKYHFSFGSRITLSALINAVFNNLFTIIIGKQFSTAQLGFYNRAESLKNLPITNISNVLMRVSYPLFSDISEDKKALKAAYQQILMIAIYVLAPLVILMVIGAEPITRILLTEKWLPIVPFFQIVCIAGILQPIHSFNLNILQVRGRSDLYLRLEIIKKIILVISIVIMINYGIYGLVWAQVISSVASLFVNTYYSGKFIDYTLAQQLKDLFPSIFIASIIGALTWSLDNYILIKQPDLLRLVILILLYAVLYICCSISLKRKELTLFKKLVGIVFNK